MARTWFRTCKIVDRGARRVGCGDPFVWSPEERATCGVRERRATATIRVHVARLERQRDVRSGGISLGEDDASNPRKWWTNRQPIRQYWIINNGQSHRRKVLSYFIRLKARSHTFASEIIDRDSTRSMMTQKRPKVTPFFNRPRHCSPWAQCGSLGVSDIYRRYLCAEILVVLHLGDVDRNANEQLAN